MIRYRHVSRTKRQVKYVLHVQLPGGDGTSPPGNMSRLNYSWHSVTRSWSGVVDGGGSDPEAKCGKACGWTSGWPDTRCHQHSGSSWRLCRHSALDPHLEGIRSMKVLNLSKFQDGGDKGITTYTPAKSCH